MEFFKKFFTFLFSEDNKEKKNNTNFLIGGSYRDINNNTGSGNIDTKGEK